MIGMMNILTDKQSKKKVYDYKFSIITAVYNTGIYLEEMIESVINQDIGFEENIQLILVDDGSQDNSLEICGKYKQRYSNIVILSVKHKGVSHARNIGMSEIRGKYVNFLDSDDKLETNVLSEVWEFFEKNRNYIDVVTIPLYFFDQQQGGHILNYKFKKSEIVDIEKDYNFILLSTSSSFIKSELVKQHFFDEKLKYAEDAAFITPIILKKKKYGVLNTCKYFYRKRGTLDSATQEGSNNIDWFIDYVTDYSLKLLIDIEKKWNYIPKYVYYLVMYDLQWRVNIMHKLDKVHKEEFIRILRKVLKKVPLTIIIKQKNLSLRGRCHCLLIKYTV